MPSRSSAVPDKTGARPPGRPPASGMVWIPPGRFLMGSDDHYPEEAPAHWVEVGGFWMDRTPVTNAQFLKFVKATGHISQAERPADPAAYPGAPQDRLRPASIVFVPPAGPVPLTDTHQWWHYIYGADWRHPEGPGSSIRGRDKHPVVHLSSADAEAYARWAGKQLPSEREWERAARGGLQGCEYAWGDALYPGGRAMANTWQGSFPYHNNRFDGHERTSPVGSFPPNPFGLFDMIGNVWEWTGDWYRHGHDPDQAIDTGRSCCEATEQARLNSIDPRSEHGTLPRRVVKGGSYLCAPEYCRRYRPAARMAQGVETTTSHLGFRCVVRVKP